MKLSTLNAVLTSLNFAPLHLWNSSYRVSNLDPPFKILVFGHSNNSSHARRWCHLAYVNASYPMSVAEIGEFRFCSQWAFEHASLSRVPLCVSYAFLLVKVKAALQSMHQQLFDWLVDICPYIIFTCNKCVWKNCKFMCVAVLSTEAW